MSTKWSSNGLLAVNTEDYEDVFSNLDDFSDISDDQKNFPIDWYFPIINVREDDQWLLLENESHISDVCNIFKDKLLCEFQTEIFLQHPLVILKLIKWLNENKETDLILECLNYLVEELIKRHYEYTTGLSENFESINFNNDSSSQITILDSENTTNDGISRWGIAKFCVSMLPLILKHISYNSIGAFSLFMSNIHLLSSISESCNVNFYLDSVFYNYMTKNLLLNEPLSSLKLLVIAKKLLTFCLHNDKFKNIIGSILKQPYWIHLYPELYHQLYAHIINEEPLELKIIKMVENVHILLSTNMLDMKQHAQLFKTALPIMWFHKKFHIIDKFIIDTCKHVKLIKINNKNEYSNILLNLLSFKSSDVVIHTYSVLNDTVKKLLNNLYSDSNKIDRLIANLLSTDVLNEIICLGCVNSNEQISQLALEFTEQLLKSKNIINNDQWQCILNNLSPILPVLYCHANQKSTLGQTIFNLFDPDQSGKFNIKKLVLLHSIIVMLLSKDNKSRIEANNRITWLLKTSLNKSIDLPNNIFIIEFEDFNDKSEEPVGEYNENDLDGMLDLISNKCSSRQTIKCALYKLSVMLEHSHLQQYFIDNGGMNTIYNLLKSSKLFENERGLLIALLKLLLCFAKENKCISNEHNLLANNFEIQLQLISILSDFYEIPLVKQYILHIFFYCIFKQYLKEFGNIPEVVMDKIYIPININKYWKSNNNYDDTLDLRIKDDKNCMDVLVLNWHLKHFNNIDLFLKNGPTMEAHCYLFNDVFKNFQKASINWYVNKLLIDLIAATSHPVALCILGDLIRYLELSVYIQQFKLDEELLETALKKFLILPPIFITDLQTLIVVLKLLNFALKKRILINKLNWVADALIKSESMHHNMADDFKNDEKSIKLCNQFFVELYEVYWLCLKNFIHFSTSNLTKLLFNQLSSTKNEFVLFQINMKCLTVLTENKKNIDNNLVKTYLSQIMSLKTILMNNSGEKNLQRNYLKILNHILHHTILVPNICEVWGMYDWESWTWSMIHSTDPLVRALVYQFSAGLAVIDITVSPNLIQLALNYFCESNRLENCVVAEQATIFCSNIFCNPKFKRLCLHYINKLDFNAFVQIINLCLQNDYTKSENKNFSTSPKLVANICCMLYNMFTLTELDLHQLDQNNQFVLALIMCLKRYLTPICIEKPNVMEMCGRICSILTLFIPTSNYSFENLITSLNLIYEKINIDLDHCTTMVWRSLFKLTNTVLQYTNNKSCIITDNLISALSRSITSKNNDLCNDALNTISAVCSKLSQKFAHSLCKVVIDTLILNWQQKLKRKILLITLSNIVLEHPFTYETVKQDNLLCFMITKLKIMQLQMTKQSSKNLKTLQNDYLEIVEFCCNIFHGCIRARENASSELPDIIHKLWPIVAANPKSDMLICTIQMLISLTSNCPSACSAMTMTSSTLGVDPKSKCTSYSLFHEIISLASDFHLHGDILNITLLLILNCCQAQECRIIIAKSKLLSNIVSVLDLKDKKRLIKIEQQCLNLLLIFSSYSEGQINILKIDYVLDTLVNLLNSNYKDDSIAILRNLCFNVQNRIIVLSSDVFMNGIKTMLEMGENLSSQQFKDISLALWAIAYKSQKSRLQLRHWGIDKYYEKCSNLLTHDNETQNIIKRTYQILKH